MIGIESIYDPDCKVLIHDGVRPFVSHSIINSCIKSLNKYCAVTVAIPCVDTIIKVGSDHLIENIPKRNELMRVQTPQGFKINIIKEAHREH